MKIKSAAQAAQHSPAASDAVGSGEAARQRVVIIDILRGLALVYMIYYHTVFDLAFIFGTEWGIAAYYANENIVPFCVTTFVAVSGISTSFSHNNAKRGGRLLVVGIALTFITAFLFEGSAIYFGILQLLGTSIVFYGAFEERLRKLPAIPMIIASLLVFALTFNTKSGYVGIGSFTLNLPDWLTANNQLYPYGMLSGGFSSVDYTPLLPWFFMFLAGTYVGVLIKKSSDRLPKFCFADPLPPISFMGRHSLIIYLAHQPIILALLYLLNFITGGL